MAAGILLSLNWYLAGLKAAELQAAVNNLQLSSDELIQQININYENSLLIDEVKGQLSPRSYEFARQILKEIEFEGIYRTAPEIAGSHHERVDGTGYPREAPGATTFPWAPESSR